VEIVFAKQEANRNAMEVQTLLLTNLSGNLRQIRMKEFFWKLF